MANKAVELHQPIARRWPRLPFELRLVIWWCAWLLILLFLFSGGLIAIGPIQIKTIALDWAFIGEWWPFISKGVIITFELSILSMICAVVLALSAALARLSRVASINSLASLYVSLMRGTPLFLQFIFIYSALPQFGPHALADRFASHGEAPQTILPANVREA